MKKGGEIPFTKYTEGIDQIGETDQAGNFDDLEGSKLRTQQSEFSRFGWTCGSSRIHLRESSCILYFY